MNERDETSSSSQGVFSFKKKPKNVSPLTYFSRGTRMDPTRYRAYQNTCRDFDKHVDDLYKELTSDLFADLIAYIGRNCTTSDCIDPQGTRKELATAALITGVNTPDHGQMFHQLSQLLDHKQGGIGYVALLQSKDCTTLKYTLSHLSNQLISNKTFLDDSDDDEATKTIKRPRLATMQVINSWYQEQKTGDKVKPIIIILEDIEMFNSVVLQDFIAICSKYLNNGLPVMLVFGIATCIESVHSLLNSSTSNLLTLQTFQLEASSRFLGSIVEKVILTNKIAFKISAKVFSLILDIFLYHDFSVNNFTNAFKLAMLQHYNSCSTSFLCDNHLDVDKLTEEQIDLVIEIPSFSCYLDQWNSFKSIVSKYRFMRITIRDRLRDLSEYHTNMYCMLKYLVTFIRDLPGHPLGKQYRETYVICMLSGVKDVEVYAESIKLMRNLSRVEVTKCLKECIAITKDVRTHDLDIIKQQMNNYLKEYDNLDELERLKPFKPAVVDNKVTTTSTTLPACRNIQDLRSAIKKMTNLNLPKSTSHHDDLRKRFINFLDNIFKKYLVLPRNNCKEMCLYEANYYCETANYNLNACGQLRKSLDAGIRANIQRALAEPHYYINNASLNMEKSVISDKLPDLCIAYKLHLECGKFINLYDWLQAFNMILEGDDIHNKESTAKLQARFIRCVSELQFLGFIKPTKRKTDHVARLTWAN